MLIVLIPPGPRSTCAEGTGVDDHRLGATCTRSVATVDAMSFVMGLAHVDVEVSGSILNAARPRNGMRAETECGPRRDATTAHVLADLGLYHDRSRS